MKLRQQDANMAMMIHARTVAEATAPMIRWKQQPVGINGNVERKSQSDLRRQHGNDDPCKDGGRSNIANDSLETAAGGYKRQRRT
jgi:hypothetical protein